MLNSTRDDRFTTWHRARIFRCWQRAAVSTLASTQLDDLLEGKDDTVTLWVRFLGYVDLAVDHGHDTITELHGVSSFTHVLVHDGIAITFS